jgi:phosphomevalonate kinase
MAPGKLVLTGAYAVLDGAPAIAAAVDRYAIADTARCTATPSAEIHAAFGTRAAPEVDVAMLENRTGGKLGLGSSAAALVAALGASALDRGEDISDPIVRRGLFLSARDAHARAQNGGSGVDVAASVYGGVIRYTIEAREAAVEAVEWPSGLVLAAYFTGHSARTSDLLARVRAARERSPHGVARMAGALFSAAVAAAGAMRRGASEFVQCAQTYGALLSELGALADAPIVPDACAELAKIAATQHAAFLPSGAGGGDVAVWLGVSDPSEHFAAQAERLGFSSLALRIDLGGVRRESLDRRRD